MFYQILSTNTCFRSDFQKLNAFKYLSVFVKIKLMVSQSTQMYWYLFYSLLISIFCTFCYQKLACTCSDFEFQTKLN